jgi:DNA-binding MarR family transcriptional regulator
MQNNKKSDGSRHAAILTVILIVCNTDNMDGLNIAAAKLRMVIRLLVRRIYSTAGKGWPTRSEHGVLAWLYEKVAMTPVELSMAEKVRPQTMGQTLDALYKRRWIKRTPHPKDRRQVLVSLSASGRKILLKGRESRQAWLVQEFEKLAPRDRQTLIKAIDILERIVQNE